MRATSVERSAGVRDDDDVCRELHIKLGFESFHEGCQACKNLLNALRETAFQRYCPEGRDY